jgi:glycosyltransferase involved in cell wall biosynthesis
VTHKILIFKSADFLDQASRIRGFFLGDYLSRCGWYVKYYPFSESYYLKSSRIAKNIFVIKDFLTKINAVRYSKNSIIFVQREISGHKPTLLFVFLSKHLFHKKVVYDLDDGLFISSPIEFKSIIRMSDVVVVGGHSLLDFALPNNPHSFLIPTSVNVNDQNRTANNNENQTSILGFVGSPFTINYLEVLREPLRILANKYDFTLRVIAAREKSQYENFPILRKLAANNVKIDLLPWTVESETAELKTMMIGLAPLADGMFERNKCGYRLINYMAAKVPTVASGVGENNFIIQDGVNGFLCKNSNEWITKLGRLIDSPELRESFAVKALQTVKEKYSLEKNCEKLKKILISELGLI